MTKTLYVGHLFIRMCCWLMKFQDSPCFFYLLMLFFKNPSITIVRYNQGVIMTYTVPGAKMAVADKWRELNQWTQLITRLIGKESIWFALWLYLIENCGAQSRRCSIDWIWSVLLTCSSAAGQADNAQASPYRRLVFLFHWTLDCDQWLCCKHSLLCVCVGGHSRFVCYVFEYKLWEQWLKLWWNVWFTVGRFCIVVRLAYCSIWSVLVR